MTAPKVGRLVPSHRGVRLAVVWAVALVVFGADLAAKAWALGSLAAGEVEVVPGVLWFNLVRNSGAAFGLLPGSRPLFFAVTLLLVGVGLGAPLAMDEEEGATGLGYLGLGLLEGGGLGNLYDRVFREGLVVDFIDFRFWPVFNVADMAIVVGTALVFVYLVRGLFRPAARTE